MNALYFDWKPNRIKQNRIESRIILIKNFYKIHKSNKNFWTSKLMWRPASFSKRNGAATVEPADRYFFVRCQQDENGKEALEIRQGKPGKLKWNRWKGARESKTEAVLKLSLEMKRWGVIFKNHGIKYLCMGMRNFFVYIRNFCAFVSSVSLIHTCAKKLTNYIYIFNRKYTLFREYLIKITNNMKIFSYICIQTKF